MSGTFSSGSPDRDQHIMEILREALLSPFEEASLFKETPALSAKQPPDSALVRIIHHPSVILILGHRGSGKSPLACRLQELLSPNPPKDTDGRREDSGRGWVRELQGRWPGFLG